ncbi:MAG TPA: hypothetical protein VMZ30_02110, partial [Pyrinomonadaceae bacterium]|nr:hypothetical protein [Pyrinomonadaceae bacterium]
GAVKALGENRIGGRVVTFSSASSPDRVKDFFDAVTDFWLSGTGERRPILYQHGIDPGIKKRRFGEVQISRGPDGLWATGFIAGKDEDSLNLLRMAQRGELNWSTGSVGHLVEKTPVGDAMHVDSWPIAECTLSLKDLVCEPRNIVSLKDLSCDVPDFHTLVARSPFSQSAESDEHQADVNRRAEAVIQEFRDQQQDFYNKQGERLMQEFYNAQAAYEYERLQRIIAHS